MRYGHGISSPTRNRLRLYDPFLDPGAPFQSLTKLLEKDHIAVTRIQDQMNGGWLADRLT